MVLSILSDTTRPTLVFALAVWLVTRGAHGSLRDALASVADRRASWRSRLDRHDPRDVLAGLRIWRVVVQLPGGQLEAQVVEVLRFAADSSSSSSASESSRTFIDRPSPTPSSDHEPDVRPGSLWPARRIASGGLRRRHAGHLEEDRGRACTTATQWSGAPLPEPMRTSAGFLVTGLSGKMRIQILPPRLT